MLAPFNAIAHSDRYNRSRDNVKKNHVVEEAASFPFLFIAYSLSRLLTSVCPLIDVPSFVLHAFVVQIYTKHNAMTRPGNSHFVRKEVRHLLSCPFPFPHKFSR